MRGGGGVLKVNKVGLGKHSLKIVTHEKMNKLLDICGKGSFYFL